MKSRCWSTEEFEAVPTSCVPWQWAPELQWWVAHGPTGCVPQASRESARVLELLRTDIDRTLRLIGASSVTELEGCA